MEPKLAVFLLLGLLGCAVVSDFRHHRIPNLLVLIGLILGGSSQVYLYGQNGLYSSIFGLVVGFGLLLPFYVLGGMAAGDVKLMSVVGSFLGGMTTASVVSLTLMVGGLLGKL